MEIPRRKLLGMTWGSYISEFIMHTKDIKDVNLTENLRLSLFANSDQNLWSKRLMEASQKASKMCQIIEI